MRKLIVVLAVAAVVVGVSAWRFHQQTPEETTVQGTVSGQTLANNRFPNVKFEVAPEFRYVGSQRFQLYGNADAEQHFFAEADEQKNVKRLFWIQYEGYLPTNQHTYDYSDQPIRFQHGGLEWLADVAMSRPMGMQQSSNQNPNSDGARFRAFMKAKGYTLPRQHARIRAVALDKEKRNELMIIYIEDLALTEQKPADPASAEAPKLSEELQKKIAERFRERLKVSR